MAINAYQALRGRNQRLAQFTDRNHNVALMFKKILTVLTNVCAEKKIQMNNVGFEVVGSADGKTIWMRLDY